MAEMVNKLVTFVNGGDKSRMHSILASVFSYSCISAVVALLVSLGVYKAKIDTQGTSLAEIKAVFQAMHDSIKQDATKIITLEFNQNEIQKNFNAFLTENKEEVKQLKAGQECLKIGQVESEKRQIRVETILEKNAESLNDIKQMIQKHIMTESKLASDNQK